MFANSNLSKELVINWDKKNELFHRFAAFIQVPGSDKNFLVTSH